MIKDNKKKKFCLVKKLKSLRLKSFVPKIIRIDEHVTEPKQRKTMYYLYALLLTILAIGWTLSGIWTANEGDKAFTDAFTLAIGITLAVSTLLLILVLGIVFTTRK